MGIGHQIAKALLPERISAIVWNDGRRWQGFAKSENGGYHHFETEERPQGVRRAGLLDASKFAERVWGVRPKQQADDSWQFEDAAMPKGDASDVPVPFQETPPRVAQRIPRMTRRMPPMTARFPKGGLK